jgi:ribosomal protein L9
MDIILIKDIDGYASAGAFVNVPESVAKAWIEQGLAQPAVQIPEKAKALVKEKKDK